jgi:ketosteroid isomerase-like protein
MRADLENAVYKWGRAFDAGDVAAFLDAITEDACAVFETEGGETVGPLEGRGQIGDFVRERIAGRKARQHHVTTNVTIEELDGNEAATSSYVTIIESSNGAHRIVAVGTYHDRLVLTDGTWRIRMRRLVWTGVSG